MTDVHGMTFFPFPPLVTTCVCFFFLVGMAQACSPGLGGDMQNADVNPGRLQAEVEALLHERGGRGSWSVSVHALLDDHEDGGRSSPLIVDINSNTLRTPASNTKLLTSAGVWLRADDVTTTRLRTSVSATIAHTEGHSASTNGGPSTGKGPLIAELSILGGGDMSLTSDSVRALARQCASDLHDMAAASGSTHVHVSTVRVDSSVFGCGSTGRASGCNDDSWEVQDLDSAYGSRVDAFAADLGIATLRCRQDRGAQPSGIACKWDYESEATRAVVSTPSKEEMGRPLSWSYSRQMGAYVSDGELMIGPGQTESVAFQLPVFQGSVHAKSIFGDELRIQNITLQQHDTGLMRTESMGIIGTIESASIYSLLQTQNLYSINQYAEVTRNRLHTLRH